MDITPEWLIAFATFITAITGAYASLRRRLGKVHDLVNSQHEELKAQLSIALAERDQARKERDV